jgi:hypothetical protein
MEVFVMLFFTMCLVFLGMIGAEVTIRPFTDGSLFALIVEGIFKPLFWLGVFLLIKELGKTIAFEIKQFKDS